MEIEGIVCQGCGSTNITFDPKRREVTCNQCGKITTYSRSTLNKNGKVSFQRENAINQFSKGRMDEALQFAYEVLNIAIDNAPALFIISYYDEFIKKNAGNVKKYFAEMESIALEYDEVKELCTLFLAVAYNMTEYEMDIILLIAKNMQDPEDKAFLCEFFDQLCPYMISKRTSMIFLNAELIEMYKDLAFHCDIPKTCFALLKAIENNPDSPYASNSFYLKTKVEHFYNRFVLPVGEIVSNMHNAALKEKFLTVFEQKKSKYNTDASLQ